MKINPLQLEHVPLNIFAAIGVSDKAVLYTAFLIENTIGTCILDTYTDINGYLSYGIIRNNTNPVGIMFCSYKNVTEVSPYLVKVTTPKNIRTSFVLNKQLEKFNVYMYMAQHVTLLVPLNLEPIC